MGKESMLVVDDDPSTCEELRLVGESCNFIVSIASTAQDFLAKYAMLQPDVVTLDLNLGDRDGIELLRELSSLESQSKIIVISGYDDKVINSALLLGDAQQLHIIGSLHKPIDINRLKQLLLASQDNRITITSQSMLNALEDNEFVLYYQPKVAIATGRFMGVEALIRWRISEKNLISPDSFIKIAEEEDFICALSNWVYYESIKQASYLKSEGWNINMSINLSSKLLTNLRLPDEIQKIAQAFEIAPENLCIEITESTAMGNPSLTMDVLTRFRIKGFSVSIDDFGTGYSSLVELQRLPCNELKIDKSFVTRLKRDTPEFIIVRSIINLGHDFGLRMVAEGVETLTSFLILKELGCDVVQGFFIGPPMPIEELLLWLKVNLDSSKAFKFPEKPD